MTEKWVFASDPERHQFHIISVDSSRIEVSFTLPQDSLPGRVVAGESVAFLILRGTGEIRGVSYDGAEWREVMVASACERVEGIDWDREANLLWATCLNGDVLAVNPDTGQIEDRFFVQPDIRDIVVTPNSLYVSVFRGAEVLILDRSGQIRERVLPPVRSGAQAAVAWRMRAHPRGGVLLLHQIATSGREDARIKVDLKRNAYGAGGSCRVAVMSAAVSHVRAGGSVRGGRSVGDVVLPLDIAISSHPLTPEIALAAAGNRNERVSGPPAVVREAEQKLIPSAGTLSQPACANAGIRHEDGRQVVAVAYLPDNRLVYQSINPYRIDIEGSETIRLPGKRVADTGHFLFHSDPGGGLACASCHPLGRDDGITWHFEGTAFAGPRRTPAVFGGMSETAPFHWSGDVLDYRDLMHQIFSRRMGGQDLGDEHAEILGGYVDAIPAVRLEPQDVLAVERGEQLFYSSETLCSTCHSGDLFTDSKMHNVGTGEPFQVPRLIGLRMRAPYMHDGCAETLRQRFDDPTCGGGDKHGVTSHLTNEEKDDLVAFLRSL